MSDFLGWRANNNIATNYVNTILEILSDDNKFKTFRNGVSGYTPILEHLNYNDGKIYADYIIKNYKHLLVHLDEFKKNDLIGNPIKFNYDEFGEINPTTLRYIKFAGDIQKTFGDINNVNLVEIGAGYGGLVRVLNVIYNFKAITLFDLPEALNLQKKYLNEFDITPKTYTYNDKFSVGKNTLVISNYAWCECDKKTRDIYVDKIINKVDYNFLVVYDVDLGELTKLSGEQTINKETLNGCQIFTRINKI
jgi:putative sugar O-methyltransferase